MDSLHVSWGLPAPWHPGGGSDNESLVLRAWGEGGRAQGLQGQRELALLALLEVAMADPCH